jgi:hypothetical protein
MSDQQLGPGAQHEILSPAFAWDATPGPAPMPVSSAVPLSGIAAPELVDPPTAVGDAAPDLAPEAPAPCTQAQLRRFIKSRPYVPLHELRRRFGLNGADDDVSGVDVDGRRIFIGLPERETGLLGDLLRQGDVGYELLLDPTSPLVIGVFPMRPVQRP